MSTYLGDSKQDQALIESGYVRTKVRGRAQLKLFRFLHKLGIKSAAKAMGKVVVRAI